MPLPFRPNCLPSALGALPHSRTSQVWDAILPRLARLAPLPLLARSGESLLELALRDLPGVYLVGEQPTWEERELGTALDKLYVAYLRHETDTRALDLAAFNELERREGLVRGVRAFSTVQWGPLSLAMLLINAEREPALGDPIMLEAITKHLYLRMQWQAEVLGHWDKPLVQWLYEPYLEMLDSPFVPVGWSEARVAFSETFGTHAGVRGIWAGHTVQLPELVQGDTVDVVGLTLPTPDQAENWTGALQDFIRRKGVIGWGIIPATSDGLRNVTAGRLAGRFGSVLKALNDNGLPVELVVRSSIIMPEDTLDQLAPAEAERALSLTVELAELLRQAYDVE